MAGYVPIISTIPRIISQALKGELFQFSSLREKDAKVSASSPLRISWLMYGLRQSSRIFETNRAIHACAEDVYRIWCGRRRNEVTVSTTAEVKERRVNVNMQTATGSFPFYQYWFCVVGILISIVLPILRQLLPKPAPLASAVPPWKRYAGIGLFSLVTAVVVIAFGRGSVSSWQWFDALLAGYAWDSTLQKVING